MICSNIVGSSLYEKSIFVMCDCNSHIMTIFVYKGYEGNLFTGVDYFGYYKPRRNSNPYVGFEDLSCLIKISAFLKSCKLDENVCTEITIPLSSGRFTVSYDKSLGFIDFNKYARKAPKKKEKEIWNVCIKEKYIDELTTEIDALVKFVEDQRKDSYCF